MKKNLITVIILALVLANLILTAILVFTIIPQTKKSNQLIDQVCSAINLELQSGENTPATPEVPIEDVETYAITDGFTVNLKQGEDGKQHYAVFSVSLSLNTKSDGYKSIGTEGLKAITQSEINTIVNGYTLDEFNANGYQNVKDDILKTLQDMFGGSDFIVGVNFSSVQTE